MRTSHAGGAPASVHVSVCVSLCLSAQKKTKNTYQKLVD